MLDSKFFFTLIGLLVAVFAICKTNMSPSINEGFLPSRSVKVIREVHGKDGHGGYSLQNNYQSMLGNENFVSYPCLQAKIEPRFSNTQYGANIKYNMPSYENLASPYDPLKIGDMAQENYGNTPGAVREDYYGCGATRCDKGGVSPGLLGNASPDISHINNFEAVNNQIFSSDNTIPVIGDSLPVGDMTTINSSGEVDQHIVYDRYIYAPMKSRLAAHGDHIRGDLAIPFDSSRNWFSVHPNPKTDLRQGAMHVMGGIENETSRALSDLIQATSGGTHTTMAGVDLNMSNQFSTTLGAAGGDVQVTAFA